VDDFLAAAAFAGDRLRFLGRLWPPRQEITDRIVSSFLCTDSWVSGHRQQFLYAIVSFMLGELPLRSGDAQLRGDALHATARDKLAATSGTMLSQAFGALLNELPIDWDLPRGSGEVNAIATSLTNALRYAYLRTSGAAPQLDTSDACNNAIKELLGDSDKTTIFRDNAWRPPTSFAPLRGVPLQYILRHRYRDAVIRGIEVGAGLNNLISKLNSQIYFDADVPHKDKLASFARHVNVSLGLGIDKQERDLLWALASFSGSQREDADRLRDWLAVDEQQFPFLVADISESATVHKVNATINPTGDTPHVGFVVSSFCKYQLDNDEHTQQAYKQFAPTFLSEGGILIESGDEVMPKQFSVSVYKKLDGEMRFVGSPFTIATDGQILSVDLSYFT
jgi:hypothetical protein